MECIDIGNCRFISALGQRLGVGENFERSPRRIFLRLPHRPRVGVSAFHVANLSDAAHAQIGGQQRVQIDLRVVDHADGETLRFDLLCGSYGSNRPRQIIGPRARERTKIRDVKCAGGAQRSRERIFDQRTIIGIQPRTDTEPLGCLGSAHISRIHTRDIGDCPRIAHRAVKWVGA